MSSSGDENCCTDLKRKRRILFTQTCNTLQSPRFPCLDGSALSPRQQTFLHFFFPKSKISVTPFSLLFYFLRSLSYSGIVVRLKYRFNNTLIQLYSFVQWQSRTCRFQRLLSPPKLFSSVHNSRHPVLVN